MLEGKKGPRKFDVEAMFEKTRRTARELMASNVGSHQSADTGQYLVSLDRLLWS